MRQYSVSEKHYLSILQINAITCWEINENESTAVMGFQTNFPSKSSFLAESKYGPQAYEISYCLCVHMHWEWAHISFRICEVWNEP